MSVTDCILPAEVNLIVFLQKNLEPYECTLQSLSEWMKPVAVASIWTPLIGAFDMTLLMDLMILVHAITFITIFTKWTVPEDRPYWWVHETSVYDRGLRPEIKILPETCETSSGSFSSHSAVFTVFLYVIGLRVIKILSKQEKYNKPWVRNYINIVILVCSAMMWISRMYIGTHFLHQCLCGSALGAGLVYYYYNNMKVQQQFTEVNRKRALQFAFGCSLMVILTYGIMLILKFDLQWSVRLAFNWCGNLEYLKPTSTPVYAMIKELGVIFGAASAFPLAEKRKQKVNLFISSSIAVAIIVIDQIMIDLTPLNNGPFVFFLFAFVRSCAVSYCICDILPKLSIKLE